VSGPVRVGSVLWNLAITDHVSGEGSAIGRVHPSTVTLSIEPVDL